MQGHGYAQPVKQPPATGWLVFLRVLFVVVSFCSLGFLAWSMLLRLALVTRKSLDWGLFVAVLAVDVLSVVLLGSEPGDEIHTTGGWLGLGLLLGTLVAAVAYYLAAEIRHFHQLSHGPVGYPAGTAAPAYGYPQAQTQVPYTATTVQQGLPPVPRMPAPQPPLSQPAVPQPPVAGPPAQHPGPARIDQVRAELDELSDYLRKHDGNHEGGR
ncbi:hypothetical protein [Streptomyces mangrovisoli]|uniref:Integral membrane protein n=1 Tax=Streptomyces mangrovisoli TaxID=1428628 RepID=A0A1J4NKY9_9ACTN|nr:hypothetical protein [Streptomyces mangrovisoli]OIJ62999.1 hypothetical protein WN71_036510 [Streptomyces mangrovisoli]